MFPFTKYALLGLVFGGSLFLAGCAATGSAEQTAAAPSMQGVKCAKCDVTWVKVPANNGKGQIVSYTTHKTMVCPDCKSAVDNFFATGKLEHSCKTCGSSMEICEAH